MLADGRTVPHEEAVRTDVCVIGAGPSGITLSRELAAAGFEVLLLERGGADPTGPRVNPDTAMNIGIPYQLAESRAFELGGALNIWRVSTPIGGGLGRLREMDSNDFEHRAWVPFSGWPFAKDELLPFYQRARALFDFDWPPGFQEDWDADLESSVFSDKLRTRVFCFANPAVFPGELRRGLEHSDKVLVLINSTVVDIRCDYASSSVSAVKVMTAPDHAFTVQAQAYVLAAGGIENARLLLVSRSRFPKGFGNGRDLVGRFFMEHPHYASGRLVPRDPAVFAEPTHYDIQLQDGQPMQKKYSLGDDVVRREQLSRCVYRFEAKPVNESVRTLRYSESAIRSLEAAGKLRRDLARGEVKAATSHVADTLRGAHHVARVGATRAVVKTGRRLGLSRYTQPQMFWIRAMAEQLPNPESRVGIDDRLVDRFGVPIATLDWRLGDHDMASMRRSQELLGQALLEAGHKKVDSLLERDGLPPALSGGDHHMGTTRMHDSPRRGVVDRDCRMHGVGNFYIAGSSVFPTGGYANPTLTIVALAFRLADHLKRELARM